MGRRLARIEGFGPERVQPRMTRFIGPLMVLAAVACALPSVASAQGNMRQPLTAQERRTLRQGHIVTRPSTERRGPLRLFGGTSYIVVDLPVDAVWRALTDRSSRYRHMLPQVHRAREISRNGDESREIRFEHEVGPIDASYVLRFEYDPDARTVVFRLAANHPHDIRAAWGFFRVRATGDRTLVSFGAMVDVGDGLLTGSLQSRLHEWVLKIPWTFKQYLEGSGRRHYVAD